MLYKSDDVIFPVYMRAYIGVSIDQMSFKWCMVVVFIHIASELVDVGWFSFSIRAVSLLSQHHCW